MSPRGVMNFWRNVLVIELQLSSTVFHLVGDLEVCKVLWLPGGLGRLRPNLLYCQTQQSIQLFITVSVESAGGFGVPSGVAALNPDATTGLSAILANPQSYHEVGSQHTPVVGVGQFVCWCDSDLDDASLLRAVLEWGCKTRGDCSGSSEVLWDALGWVGINNYFETKTR